MTFVNPTVLFWLIPLGGFIIILYLLKMRRKELRVPASFLWPQMTYEVRANSLFQKLKFTWLLFLQLLALTAIVFALARPQIRQQSLSGEVTVIVVDTSASMSATDVKPSRLAEALKVANQIVATVTAGDRLSVIEAGPMPRVVFPLSNDPSMMRNALATVKPTDAAGDVGEAMRLASSMVAKAASGRIILLSDGVFGEVPNFSPGRARILFQKIGTSGENTAISALGIGDSPSGPQLFCGLKNYGSQVSEGVVNIYADGKLFNSFKVSINPKSSSGQTMTLPPNGNVFEARLENDDYLAADNYAVCLRNSSKLSVLLVTNGDLFLERALSLDPRVSLYKAGSVPQTGRFDIVVFDGVREQRVNAAGVLDLGAAGSESPVSAHGVTIKPSFKAEDYTSPILKGVTLTSTFVSRAESATPRAGASVLASGSNGPWIVASKREQRHLYMAFSPLDSDFPLQVGFPIFIANTLSYLAPVEATTSDLEVNAGHTIALPGSDSDLRLSGPEQINQTIKNTHGQYVLRGLTRVGKYEAGKRNIYVTFGAPQQSQIAPVDRTVLGHISTVALSATTHEQDLWRFVSALALCVLGMEWWLFMRRS